MDIGSDWTLSGVIDTTPFQVFEEEPVAMASEDSDMSANDAARAGQRILRFSLRGASVLCTVLGLLFAIIAHQYQQAFKQREEKQLHVRLLDAVRDGDAAGVSRAISAGADVNHHAGTPLLIAIGRDDLTVAELLLEAGADLELAYGNPSHTSLPLHVAIRNGSIRMLQFLLDHGVDTEAATWRGTPLIYAIESGKPADTKLRMVQILLERGANVTSNKSRAMDLAVAHSYGELGDLLHQYGAAYSPREAAAFDRVDEVKQMVNAELGVLERRYPELSTTGVTLLEIALQRGYQAMAVYLLEAGSPTEGRDYRGRTALHHAAIGGAPQLVHQLVTRGLDVNAADANRVTPLHEAAMRGHINVVRLLIVAGADVNAQTELRQPQEYWLHPWCLEGAIGTHWKTPLMDAAVNNHLNVARLLLESGVRPPISHDGRTVFGDRTPNPRVMKLLKEFSSNVE